MGAAVPDGLRRGATCLAVASWLVGGYVLFAGTKVSEAQSGVTADQAAKNRARPYLTGMAHLKNYRVGRRACRNGPARGVESSIAEMKKSVSLFHTAGLYRYEAQARQRHTALAFGYAEAALKKRCLDAADRICRGLVHFYVGAAYSGMRDRARICIDDVRDARRRR